MRSSFVVLLSLAGGVPLAAQEAYRTPPQVVVDAIDAPPLPGLSLSPNREWAVLTERSALPTIAELAQPMLRLAGIRLNPATNGPHRVTTNTGLRFKSIADGREIAVRTPAGAKLGGAMWAPDSRHVAFTITGENGIALWVASVATGEDDRVVRPLREAGPRRECGA